MTITIVESIYICHHYQASSLFVIRTETQLANCFNIANQVFSQHLLLDKEKGKLFLKWLVKAPLKSSFFPKIGFRILIRSSFRYDSLFKFLSCYSTMHKIRTSFSVSSHAYIVWENCLIGSEINGSNFSLFCFFLLLKMAGSCPLISFFSDGGFSFWVGKNVVLDGSKSSSWRDRFSNGNDFGLNLGKY